ncbi:MAG: hypothetical protein FalmKO_30880 [Falsiruegeria mediterranea]
MERPRCQLNRDIAQQLAAAIAVADIIQLDQICPLTLMCVLVPQPPSSFNAPNRVRKVTLGFI